MTSQKQMNSQANRRIYVLLRLWPFVCEFIEYSFNCTPWSDILDTFQLFIEEL